MTDMTSLSSFFIMQLEKLLLQFDPIDNRTHYIQIKNPSFYLETNFFGANFTLATALVIVLKRKHALPQISLGPWTVLPPLTVKIFLL
jgi:hypothetical protein